MAPVLVPEGDPNPDPGPPIDDGRLTSRPPAPSITPIPACCSAATTPASLRSSPSDKRSDVEARSEGRSEGRSERRSEGRSDSIVLPKAAASSVPGSDGPWESWKQELSMVETLVRA